MSPSIIISPQLLEDLGLLKVMEACHCRSPQGNKLKQSVQFFGNADRQALDEELTGIQRLLCLLRMEHPEVSEAQTQLSRLRELRGTLNRLDKAGLLNDTEFFELKSALRTLNAGRVKRICSRLRGSKSQIPEARLNYWTLPTQAALLFMSTASIRRNSRKSGSRRKHWKKLSARQPVRREKPCSPNAP